MMNRLPDPPNAVAYDSDPSNPSLLQQTRAASVPQRLWAGWLWLTGPQAERFGSDLASQELLRRSRLISAVLAILVLVLCFFIPSGLGGYSLVWVQIATMASCGVLVAVLNRVGRVTLSALVMTLLVDITLAQFLLFSLPKLNTTNLADLDLFTIAVLIGGILLPRWLIASTSALQICLIILLFVLKPHDPVLDAEIGKYEAGLAYAALTDPILLQICGASIALLYAWSVERALLRANRAEELAEARAHISAQAREIAGQKHRLEEGIALLQDAQARVANGEYGARISLQKNELLPVAVSFNLMAERLSRNEQAQQAYRRLTAAVQQLLEAFVALGQQMEPAGFTPTGTLADQLFPFLVRFRSLTFALARVLPLAQDTQMALQRQQHPLAQIESNLSSMLLLIKELNDTAAVAESAYSMMAPTRLESAHSQEPLANLPRVRTLLDRQKALVDQTRQLCAQVHELSRQGFQSARVFNHKLKEAS
ncbi:MAG TPA: hypothetical protein VKT82_26440 [Ktedonobacterales bacterium]|nr:hypothetical protein [Ktedonobacterales bacterium]